MTMTGMETLEAKERALASKYANNLQDTFRRYLMGVITWGEFVQSCKQREAAFNKECTQGVPTKLLSIEGPTIQDKLHQAKTEAYNKALDSLGRYKFLMGGYWAAQWVMLNKLEDNPDPNPFGDFVELAKNLP